MKFRCTGKSEDEEGSNVVYRANFIQVVDEPNTTTDPTAADPMATANRATATLPPQRMNSFSLASYDAAEIEGFRRGEVYTFG